MTDIPSFLQLIDIRQIQKLLEAQHEINGLATAILDVDQNILLSIGWQEICTRFHRANPLTGAACRESDAIVRSRLRNLEEGYLEYRCRNGLEEAAIPIVIEGEVIAVFYVGQFFYEDDKPDIEVFKQKAGECGFSEEEYLDAVGKIPVFSRERIRSILAFDRNLMELIAEVGLKNLKLARSVADCKSAERQTSLFRSLVESTRDPVYILDPGDDFRLVYVNEAACAHFGRSREELLTMRVPDFDPLANLEALRSNRPRLRQGKPMRFETLHRVASGELIPVEVTANYLEHDGREFHVGHFHNISKRKAMEAALKESERNLIEAQRIARVGNWVLDPDGNVVYASDEAYRIAGVHRSEFGGTLEAFIELVHPEDRENIRAAFLGICTDNVPYWLEARISLKNGIERTVHIRGEAVTDDSGKPVRVVGILQDISDRKKIEEELVRAAQELREKERLLVLQSRQASLGEMMDNIAHQWRQPLHTLALIVQDLSGAYRVGELDEHYLDDAVRKAMEQILHMSETIEDFRSFYRPDKEKVDFEVEKVIEGALSLVHPTFSKLNITIETVVEGHPKIKGFPNEYSHAVLNILLNARDVFFERGIREPKIRVTIRSENGKSIVSIADNGGGIADDLINKVFDLGITTKRTGGTGVGLFMSKMIIERNMNGRIYVESTGEGAEFTIVV